ncbi:MAG: hypothetical protein H6710_03290 [Myxococcales bacterium]|nr:hypothetical protein [Myxococcales bacterium]
MRSFAPAPSQRRELAVAAIGLAIFAIAPLAIAGLHPLAIALSAFVIVGALAGVLLHGRRQRAADLRGLWAIVEGTFGPLELAAGGDAPRRREAPGDASDPTQTRSGSR